MISNDLEFRISCYSFHFSSIYSVVGTVDILCWHMGTGKSGTTRKHSQNCNLTRYSVCTSIV